MNNDPIVIVSMARTPIGNLLGSLKDFSAIQLGTHVIKTVVEKVRLPLTDIQEVFMGCVLPGGLGQAPARQAALKAGLANTTSCTTINKVCGSGMKAVMLCHDLLLQTDSIMLAGGMESMTNAPFLLLKGRQGYRLGSDQLYDHMMLDGLEDAYDKAKPMGFFAEQCVEQYGFTRKIQDDYAMQSFERAQHATREKAFATEIAPIIYHTKMGEQVIDQDEHPFSVNPEKIPTLKPVFKKDGTITAGNSSSIADGAAALLLMRASQAEKRHLQPIARIVGHFTASRAPSEFPIAPIDAIRGLMEKIKWSASEVDLYEINEAFAVVTLAAMQDLKIPHEKLNVHGGACALGHPVGASGARIIITLLAALSQRGLKKGIAALCIGGGEATAIALERC